MLLSTKGDLSREWMQTQLREAPRFPALNPGGRAWDGEGGGRQGAEGEDKEAFWFLSCEEVTHSS